MIDAFKFARKAFEPTAGVCFESLGLVICAKAEITSGEPFADPASDPERGLSVANPLRFAAALMADEHPPVTSTPIE